MVGTLKLVRRPITRAFSLAIKNEILTAYNTQLAPYVKKTLEVQIKDWSSMPNFVIKAYASRNMYVFEVRVDMRTKMGQIYKWVDKGTGTKGPTGQPHAIMPINADFLQFTVPYQPKTYPPDGSVDYDVGAPEHVVRTGIVKDQAIKPRKFTEEAIKVFKDRRNTKGWYRITENAYRRGFRKAKKQHETLHYPNR